MNDKTSPELARVKYLVRWAHMTQIHDLPSGLRTSVTTLTRYNTHAGSPQPDPAKVVATYVENERAYFYTAAEMPSVRALEKELEQEFAKKQLFWPSPALSDVLVAANDRCKRADLKACPDMTMIGPTNAGDVIRWAMLPMKMFGIDQEVVFGISGETMFFFKCGEQEAIRRVDALPDAKRVASPAKVLVKMISSRLLAVQVAVRNENKNRAACRARDAEQAAMKPGDKNYIQNYQPNGQPDMVVCDMDSLANVRRALEVMARAASPWMFRDVIKDLEKVLKKEGVNDAVVREAWDGTVVRNVLES